MELAKVQIGLHVDDHKKPWPFAANIIWIENFYGGDFHANIFISISEVSREF